MEKNLEYWKEWVRRNETAYREELDKMDRREALYRGEGQFQTLPSTPLALSRSITGVSTDSRGVLPPRTGVGSSAIPSPITRI